MNPEQNFQTFVRQISQNDFTKFIKILIGITGYKLNPLVIYSNYQYFNQISSIITDQLVYDPYFDIKVANRISIFIKNHEKLIQQEMNPIDQISQFFHFNCSIYSLINPNLNGKMNILNEIISSIETINTWMKTSFMLLKEAVEIIVKQKMTNDILLDPIDQQMIKKITGVNNIQQALVILIAVRNKYSIQDDQGIHNGIKKFFEK
ncbi:hypothetical protein SS50377_22192 [Spironucleus salmonicida]|uniref:Uncharacterized protein n=1 Tax=Spironucleus salmonicida TaxID=348837 RepID=V6LPJ9_9EUKA|nr:hypothetical protein SS50377_22192 [Spironucleus salmonicida]|eukprot:EST45646.1 Hypothetical protein SS50377_14218 [Spironucleus salmonicida]